MADLEEPASRFLPVDGHVHFHEVAGVAPTLDAAAANFRLAGQRDSGLLGVLLLTQSRHERVFEQLRELRNCGPWALCPSPGEDESLQAEHEDSRILIVCGRQIRCESGQWVGASGIQKRIIRGVWRTRPRQLAASCLNVTTGLCRRGLDTWALQRYSTSNQTPYLRALT